MRSSKALLFAVAVVCCTAPQSTGRRFVMPDYQELLEHSDLVVIATPTTKTADTREQSSFPNIFQQDDHGNRTKVMAIGVETAFRVESVLKGEKSVREFVLHHYREASKKVTIDGPFLVSFDPVDMKGRDWLLFLIREEDGRYAPTGGQTDPGFRSIRRL
jgi:hypothetical protein